MNNFLNRVDSQREILRSVNKRYPSYQSLNGLSEQAINHWANENKRTGNDELVILLFEASEKLYFLANKSQEQITEEYKELSLRVQSTINRINNLLFE